MRCGGKNSSSGEDPREAVEAGVVVEDGGVGHAGQHSDRISCRQYNDLFAATGYLLEADSSRFGLREQRA